LFHLGFRLRHPGLVDQELGLGDVLLVQRKLVIFLRLVEGGDGNDTLLGHLLRPHVSPLQQWDLWPFGIHLGALEVCHGCFRAGLSSL
jgi:hypothetical protein